MKNNKKMFKYFILITLILVTSCNKTNQKALDEIKKVQKKEIVSDVDGMILVNIPSGTFIMGSFSKDAYYDEIPEHEVYLDEYWIDKFEVTNNHYSICLESGYCSLPNTIDHYLDPDNYNHPVKGIAWGQAKDYCTWAGRDLPTEAQWEKAARGTDGRVYPWGNDEPNLELANYLSVIFTTTEVGSYPKGQSPYGVMDMAGNLWEWVNDWHDKNYYITIKNFSRNPRGPDVGEAHVFRGGAYDSSPVVLRSSTRMSFYKDKLTNEMGFRCVLNGTP